MPPEDPTAYYTLVATILVGVVVVTVVQLPEIGRSLRRGPVRLVDRISFLTTAAVAFAAVAALAEIPSIVRGEGSWLTYGRLEFIGPASGRVGGRAHPGERECGIHQAAPVFIGYIA